MEIMSDDKLLGGVAVFCGPFFKVSFATLLVNVDELPPMTIWYNWSPFSMATNMEVTRATHTHTHTHTHSPIVI